MIKQYIVAVIGATGLVGREVIKELTERNFPIKKLVAVASENSVGKEVSFGDATLKIVQITDVNFAGIDIVLFCAGSMISKKYAGMAVKKGCVVIDKSSYYRLDDNVPLVVPEVNSGVLKNFKSGIISNPNCCVIPLAVVLYPLDNVTKIKRVIVSTYQSVSGAGKLAMEELYIQTKAKMVSGQLEPKIFPNQIAFNLFPHIGNFRKNGYTEEEFKIQEELKKVVGKHINSTITCVRIPIFVSHSMSVNVEFNNRLDAKKAENLLDKADGVTVYRNGNETKYTTPVEAVENDEVFVSRIRNDFSNKNSINMWICADNLRKGAALNAIQIAEKLIKP